MEIFLLIIGGLIFGSFLSALIWRMRTGESMWNSRSKCPNCHHQLAWYDLIPILSWMLLLGRCRYCKQPVSWYYPLLELVTVTVSVLAVIGPSAFTGWSLFIYILLSALLIIVAVYDLRWMELPDSMSIAIAVVGLANVIWLAAHLGYFWWQPFLSSLIGLIIGAGFFGLQYVLSKGKWIGFGDILLGGAIGLLLGWPAVLLGLVVAYIVGSVVSVILLFFKKKYWSSAIPFAPFLAFGAWLAFRYGDPLMILLGWK